MGRAAQPIDSGAASVPSSEAGNCQDTDGPWTAIGQALESKDRATSWFTAAWSAYKFSGPVRVLIVTVPDPVHTRLALYFDRAIDSLVAAASANGYTLDRFWLPWKDTSPPAEPDCSFRLQAKSETRRREKEPGLILFRSSGQDKGMLLVFLVSESPVYGTDRYSFRTPFVTAKTPVQARSASSPIVGLTSSAPPFQAR